MQKKTVYYTQHIRDNENHHNINPFKANGIFNKDC